MRRVLACLVILPWAAPAAGTWLIAGSSETAVPGAPLHLEVVKPAGTESWPASLRLQLAADGGDVRELELHALDDAAASAAPVRTYGAEFPSGLQGVVRARLLEPASNRIALLVEAPAAIPVPQEAAEPLPAEPVIAAAPAGGPLPRGDEATLPVLSINEPMYFLVGKHGSAKFQLSFKYRLFDPEGIVAKPLPFLGHMYLGYTQTSLWDLGTDSRPFRDTSYRPSLFWEGEGPDAAWWPDLWRGGYEHESNGKDAAASRSIDTLFLQPTWRHVFADDSVLAFRPRFRAYLKRQDNPDIHHYRGYAEWILEYGREQGLLLAAKYRQGTRGYASGQIDASYPIGRRIFSNIGSFLHLQWFSGYGETLLDYDRRDDQLRLGISIVR